RLGIAVRRLENLRELRRFCGAVRHCCIAANRKWRTLQEAASLRSRFGIAARRPENFREFRGFSGAVIQQDGSAQLGGSLSLIEGQENSFRAVPSVMLVRGDEFSACDRGAH